MSHSASYQYRIEAQRRRELYLQRIRENTLRHVEIFQRRLNNLDDETRSYVEREVQQLRASLSAIAVLAQSNPEAARDRSLSIEKEVFQLRYLAKDIQRQFSSKFEDTILQLQREQQQQKSLLHQQQHEWLTQQLQLLQDPVLTDFLRPQIGSLLEELQQLSQDDWQQIAQNKWETALTQATTLADQWKEQSTKRNGQAIQKDRLQSRRDLCREEQHCEGVTERLEELDSLDTLPNAEEQLQEWDRKMEEVLVEEEIRQEIVRDVTATLKDLGFVVRNPVHNTKNGKDEILVSATMPAGQRAMFLICSNGELKHKFDSYEGQACKDDVSSVIEKLKSVYGVELSKERVLWELPLKQSKDARPKPTSNRRRK